MFMVLCKVNIDFKFVLKKRVLIFFKVRLKRGVFNFYFWFLKYKWIIILLIYKFIK